MKRRTINIIAILTLTIIMFSCSNLTPAGFWTNFHKDLVTSKESDQGPWGGHRDIHWKSINENIFSSREILDFATKNGWQLTDSILFTADSLNELTNDRKIKHEYPFYVSNDYSDNILINTVLPKCKITDYIMVYRFKTGWVAVEPGNARDTEKNGFVTINSNGTELIIYHLWGE